MTGTCHHIQHFFFFLWYWGLNSRPTPTLHQPFFFFFHQPFLCVCDGFLQDRVLRTISPGWLQTMILLISASWVARITGMSHWSRLPLVTISWSLTTYLGPAWAKLFPSSSSVFRKTSEVLVAHTCNPRYSGIRDQENRIRSQPKQIVCETLSQKNPAQKQGWKSGSSSRVPA
jgi:hypothetical protein